MNYELEMMWKEAVLAEPRLYPSIFLADLRRATKNLGLAAVLIEIRNKHLSTISLLGKSNCIEGA
jgi:hypothetical protein